MMNNQRKREMAADLSFVASKLVMDRIEPEDACKEIYSVAKELMDSVFPIKTEHVEAARETREYIESLDLQGVSVQQIEVWEELRGLAFPVIGEAAFPDIELMNRLIDLLFVFFQVGIHIGKEE